MQKVYPGIIREEWEWNRLQRLNSVPRCHLELQTTPPQRYAVCTSALKPILVVTMPGVAVTLKSVIHKIISGTNLNLVNLLQAENVNLTHKNLKTSTDEPENQKNIHLIHMIP